MEVLFDDVQDSFVPLVRFPCRSPLLRPDVAVPRRTALRALRHDFNEADRLWELGVQEERWQDDWDAAEDFRVEYIAKRVPLAVEAVAYIDQYRAMLRTLSIPPAWERCDPSPGRYS